MIGAWDGDTPAALITLVIFPYFLASLITFKIDSRLDKSACRLLVSKPALYKSLATDLAVASFKSATTKCLPAETLLAQATPIIPAPINTTTSFLFKSFLSFSL